MRLKLAEFLAAELELEKFFKKAVVMKDPDELVVLFRFDEPRGHFPGQGLDLAL